MDYRALLIAYIQYIQWAESVDFILEAEDFISRRDLSITDEQWAELERLAQIARDTSPT